jgi:hypothetical protein
MTPVTISNGMSDIATKATQLLNVSNSNAAMHAREAAMTRAAATTPSVGCLTDG